MRGWLFLLLVLAGLWYLSKIEEQPRPTAEDSFIGGPVKTLRKAEKFEESYLKAIEEHQKRTEEQLVKDSGG